MRGGTKLAEKMSLGGGPPGVRNSPPQRKASGGAPGLRRELPPALLIAVIAVLVIALGAGTYYFINGGWATQAQKEAQFRHEVFPITAAKRGMTEPLEAENRRRQQAGQPLLHVPETRHESAAKQRAKLLELQQKLMGNRSGQPTPNP
jgi:uncharacterized protein HemX